MPCEVLHVSGPRFAQISRQLGRRSVTKPGTDIILDHLPTQHGGLLEAGVARPFGPSCSYRRLSGVRSPDLYSVLCTSRGPQPLVSLRHAP